jgi:hypothetical protein
MSSEINVDDVDSFVADVEAQATPENMIISAAEDHDVVGICDVYIKEEEDGGTDDFHEHGDDENFCICIEDQQGGQQVHQISKKKADKPICCQAVDEIFTHGIDKHLAGGGPKVGVNGAGTPGSFTTGTFHGAIKGKLREILDSVPMHAPFDVDLVQHFLT